MGKNKKHIIAVLVFLLTASVFSETLFEIKDSSDNVVFNVSDDGLRILNEGDTLMVISSEEIKANIGTSGKGLSRSFSVTTTQSKGSSDLMRLTSDSTRFWISDEGSGFGVASQSATEKSVAANFLKVTNTNTEMREGLSGDVYTNFSPENIFLGLNTGINNDSISGFGNVFIGNDAGVSSVSGNSNVFVGKEAGFNNISGCANVYIGLEAGHSSTDKHWNTFIGYRAGMNSRGSGNTYVGHGSGYDSTVGDQNSYFGIMSGCYSTTGYNNSYFGYYSAMNNKDGNSNSVFGHYAGFGIDSSSTSYSDNCLFGENAAQLLKTGSRNVVIGKNSGMRISFGNNNALMGYMSGYNMTTGSNNLYLGAFSGYTNMTGTNNVFIGDHAGYSETGSNRFHLNNGYSATPLLYGTFDSPRMVVIDGTVSDNPSNYSFYVNGTAGGDYSWNNLSDKRLKKNIETINDALSKLMKLRGVNFEWKDENTPEKGRRMGFLAQEAIEVIPEVVDHSEDNDIFTMQYAPITALLVEAVKEQNEVIEELKKTNEKLIREIEEIKKNLKSKD